KLTNRPRATFTLTGSQQIMGTIDYMAPEQRLTPQQVDHRADIYSLGVVFYEMLTGELPLGRFAPPSSKPGVDPRLDGIVFRALELEPAQRYQRITEVKSDIESLTRAAGPNAPRVAHNRRLDETPDVEAVRSRVAWPAVGLIIYGLLCLGVVLTLGIVQILKGNQPLWNGLDESWNTAYSVLFIAVGTGLSLIPIIGGI